MSKIRSIISRSIYNYKRDVMLPNRLRNTPKLVKVQGIKIPIIKERLSAPMLELLYMGDYEKPELKLVKHLLDKNDIVMELGTGLGLLSSYCAKIIGSNRVFTYEANPALETYIRQTYQLNKVTPNLTICLLGEGSGEQTFYVNESLFSSSTVQRNANDRPVRVPVKSFNEEIYRINPTFLILDIEGGEYELLKTADFHTIKKIVIEVHPHVIGQEKVDFVISKFNNAGFSVNEQLSYSQELLLERD